MRFDLSNPCRDIGQEIIDAFVLRVEEIRYERFGD